MPHAVTPAADAAELSARGGPSASLAAGRVADQVLRLSHQLGRFKSCVQRAAADDSDRLTNYLLFQVLNHAPMRASALAESTQADPSTVSRQVAALVRDGILERRADPEDGRASVLHPTEEGRARHARHLARRDEHYAQMLADWSAEDQTRFAELLERFVASFDAYKSTLLADITRSSTSPLAKESNA
ncbi:MAG: MarR family transcriptional regulator [Actinomycetota bacterium]|nr:MarR family transcriptional regulator [Actinomycetota bacterium]